MMDWYAAKEGSQVGPISEARLLEMLRAGELTHDSLVWRDGLSGWLPLASVALQKDNEPGSTEIGNSSSSGLSGNVALSPGRDGYVYRCPKSRATWAKVSILLTTISGGLLNVIDLASPQTASEEVSAVDLIMGLLGLAILITLILSVVFFCLWTFRVVANSYAFGGRFNEITPGWAVGWYFIPFANLVKPYHALKEAWQSTYDELNVPPILPTWWGLWIVSNIVGNISFRMTMNSMAEEALIVDLITLAINLPLVYCVWQVISRLTSRQVQRATLSGRIA